MIPWPPGWNCHRIYETSIIKFFKKINHKKLLIFCFSGLILIYVCNYALPTFLFLLVYPIKVIVVAAYFISYLFSITLLSAICLEFSRRIVVKHKMSNYRICVLVMYVLMFLSYPVIFFAFMFQVLYALVLSRASAIASIPNTFLSLLPTAAISVVSWILRKKFTNTYVENANTETNPTAETENTSQNIHAPRSNEDNTNSSTNEEENRDQNTHDPTPTGDAGTTSNGEADTITVAESELIPLLSRVSCL